MPSEGRSTSDDEALVERVAEALFAYNTPQGHHFVIHDGGYEGIARVAIAAMTPARVLTHSDDPNVP